MAELCFGGWDKGLGLAFGFGVVMGNRLLMVVQYLCAVVAHKYSMSCDMFEFLSGPWDMQFGLSFGFWVGFGFRFGIAFESDFGGGSKLCDVCSMVGYCFFT